MATPGPNRYSRQILFEHWDERAQKMLTHSRVTLIGCGALGTVLANTLVRAGVGFLRIVDRDFIELDNLQRQVLFDEVDLAENLPKAEAAARKLRRINSAVEVEPHVTDANYQNIEQLTADADVLLDGTDNFETRFLINDVAVKERVPWIYGACIGSEGLVLPIIPHETPCLRCIWEEAPPTGMSPTCDTAGVLGPVVNLVASLQALEAMKLLAGKAESVNRRLLTVDAWSGSFRTLDMQSAREAGNCPCCRQGRYEYLAGEKAASTAALCGRDAVQVLPPRSGAGVDFAAISARLPSGSGPKRNRFLLKFHVDGREFTLFADGRAIIKGVTDPATARSLYAKYIGA